jgi:hypothetical protein
MDGQGFTVGGDLVALRGLVEELTQEDGALGIATKLVEPGKLLVA